MKEPIRMRFDTGGCIPNTYAGILNLVSTDLVWLMLNNYMKPKSNIQ